MLRDVFKGIIKESYSQDGCDYLRDMINVSCGNVPELIYYHQTEKLFDDNKEEVLELLQEIEEDLGITSKLSSGFKNDAIWLCWEYLFPSLFKEVTGEVF